MSAPHPTPDKVQRPARAVRAWLLGAVALVLAIGVGVARWSAPPEVLPSQLYDAMTAAMANGVAPGQDPICVANGLAYDQQPVNVQPDDAATLAWLNLLVEAGLYAAPDTGDAGGGVAPDIAVYRPLPELARWGGERRLCVAGAVRLEAVSHLGPVQDVRLRGKRYVGVSADVHWALDRPALWLAKPGVGEAFARELPSWRGVRWQVGATGWTLIQRRSFVQVGAQWAPSDSIERDRAVAPGRGGALPM
ncbi:MAG: hypothetical protein EOO24_36370 [Comamonadaceae bacterium]|nr:MAG: hypothetical protein EOO24_36370 [Comamonadaceae bacterium]